MFKSQFNGERLREGRIYRGVTIIELADSLGIKKQMVSKYENNKANPTFEVMNIIEDKLGFPRDYFYEESIDVQAGNVFFRSLLSTGKKDRDMQKTRAKYLAIIRAFLEEYVDFPSLDLPEINKHSFQNNSVEQIAEQLRVAWGISDEPIKDVVSLLEKKGFSVSSLELNKKKIDAFGSSNKIKDKEYYSIILGSDKSSYVRRQFGAAHELGHAILHKHHRHLEDQTPEEYKQFEKEANEFAASFLLPRSSFIKDVSIHPRDLEYYKVLKKKWRVSISAMVMRAYKLDVINQSTYNYLQRLISKNGWKTKEPLDDQLFLYPPVALKQAVELLIENEILNPKEFLKILSQEYGLSLLHYEFEQLLGLEVGYLKPELKSNENNLVSLKF